MIKERQKQTNKKNKQKQWREKEQIKEDEQSAQWNIMHILIMNILHFGPMKPGSLFCFCHFNKMELS